MSSGLRPDVEMDVVEEITYSTLDVARLAGVSYRMIDYWLRTGRIVIDDVAMPGSGSRRRFTRSEAEALIEFVDRYRAALDIIDEFRSGELWRKARGAHERPWTATG